MPMSKVPFVKRLLPSSWIR
ncbi:hypothetical protein HU200_062783 [Digitaria exilis]|uniref:Uncharacterized protein n=1 Tax=Digitaria exilis TaxID=1010633 RepID=A0A835A6C0_9POAL|nr:hypothetical protein HU200_062783 [Digitaria exilis]